MTLDEIRTALADIFSPAGKSALKEAVRRYGIEHYGDRFIPVKSYNDYGDGILEEFRLNTKTGEFYVSLHSFGDGVDRNCSASLDAFLAAARGRGYTFSWEEERLRYTHTVNTTFGCECVEAAAREAVLWLDPDAIARRDASHKVEERVKRLVEVPVKLEYRERHGCLDWTYWRKREVMWRTAEKEAPALKDLDDAAFVRYLKDVFTKAD